MEETRPVIHWTKEHEVVLAEWADKALCFKWLHLKSNNKYRRLHNLYTIPVIIMSTLTGTANFAQDKLPDNYLVYAPLVIGCINILAGIITTVQQFLHIGELNEGHRVSTIAWDKFYRRIKVELSKSPMERQSVTEFFMSASEEFDRLTETSPVIDKDIILLFKSTFDGTFTNSDVKTMFRELTKPEICDSLVSVKNSIYKAPTQATADNFFKKLACDIISSSGENEASKVSLIEEFWDRFNKELLRPPTKEEMIDNLVRDSLHINEAMIEDYLIKHIEEL